MAVPQSQQEPAGGGVALVHQVAQSPLGELWLALDQRRGPPGEHVLLRYVSLSGGATRDTLERVAAAARAAMSLHHELLLPVVEVQQHPLVVAYEYVDAQPLSTLQSSARARELLFPIGVSLRLTIDLLRALQVVHESWLGWPTEVPYGGLLPASVLVSRDGRTRLCDALVASSALLQRGFDLSADELAYRAPEQVYASSAPEPSTDVFIATTLLWELLSGRRLLSGPKEVIERKLMEHDLPPTTADLRPDYQLSRGLLELLGCSLALDPNQRPPTPGSLATALERCGHVIASHAEVAAFLDELAGPQLDRVAVIAPLELGQAAGAEVAQPAAAVQPEAEAPGAPAAAPEARERAVAPPAQPAAEGGASPAAGTRAGAAQPNAVRPRSLAAALALAMERRRASGEFPAFVPALGPAGQRAASLESLAASQRARTAVLAQDAAVASSARASAPLPLQALPPARADLPLPLLRSEGSVDPSYADEEKTTVHRAVRDPGAARGTAPSAPVRLAPKRALLAAMASVVLLFQLWMLGLARSHREGSRSPSPAPSELSSEAPELSSEAPR